jgi:hypothetical protein
VSTQAVPKEGQSAAERLSWLRQQGIFKAARVEPGGGGARLSCGFAALDALLGGGFVRGRMCELSGRAGRMSLALAALAVATQHGEVVAWIDPGNALDPRSLQGAGVLLSRFLWVRPLGAKRVVAALKAADLVLDAGGFAFVVLDLMGAKAERALPPQAAWVRLARRVEQAGLSLIVLVPEGEGHFCSGMRLVCTQAAGPLGMQQLSVEVARNRAGPCGGRVTLDLGPSVD